MTDLEQLARKVEALSGPDREVDEEISLAFGCFPYSEDRSGNLSGNVDRSPPPHRKERSWK